MWCFHFFQRRAFFLAFFSASNEGLVSPCYYVALFELWKAFDGCGYIPRDIVVFARLFQLLGALLVYCAI